MKKIFFSLFCLICLLTFSNATMEWQTTNGSPGSYGLYKDNMAPGSLWDGAAAFDFESAFTLVNPTYPDPDTVKETILLIFNEAVYTGLEAASYTPPTGPPVANLVHEYITELNKKYGVIVCTYSGYLDSDSGTTTPRIPDLLKGKVVGYYNWCKDAAQVADYGKLVGCLFIGQLPVKWFSGQEESPGGMPVTVEYPADIYYMDMDESLTDTNNDGMLDTFSSAVDTDETGGNPNEENKRYEIWTGRITAETLAASMGSTTELALLTSYFNKNVNYRRNINPHNEKALVYADKNVEIDSQASGYWLNTMDNIWGETNVDVHDGDPATENTVPNDYRLRLINAGGTYSYDYETVHVGVNSSAFGHYFTTNDTPPASEGSILPGTLNALSTSLKAYYYVFAGAGVARFTEQGHIGGSYLYSATTEGLALVGTVKAYGMENAGNFYHTFKYKSVGESLQYWLNHVPATGPDYPALCFGMNVLGDASLKRFDPAQEAIDRGIAWIKSSDLANGRGGVPSLTYRPAQTALTALVMYNRGKTPATEPLLEDCINNLTDLYIIEEATQAYCVLSPVYNTSLSVLALVASKPAVDSRNYNLIRKMRAYLMNCQYTANSGSFYYGGFRYASNPSNADNSCTQFGLMGIYMASRYLGMAIKTKMLVDDPANTAAADLAEQAELNVPAVTYTRAIGWLNRTRSAGGHYYGYSGWPVSKNMTAAAAWGYILSGDLNGSTSDFNWLGNNTPYDLSVYGYYYAYTFSKACAMASEGILLGAGLDNWYDNLSQAILGYQQATGNWLRDYNYAATGELATLFALLSLEVNKLNPVDDIYKHFILNSHSDLHIYDAKGIRHTGINYKTGKIENQIPGSSYRILDPAGNEVAYTGGPIDENHTQVVSLWMPDPGRYRVELIGTSDGHYDLELRTTKNGDTASQKTYSGEISEDIVHATTSTVAVLDGDLMILAEPMKIAPVMEISPVSVELDTPYTQTSVTFPIIVTETKGQALTEIKGYSTDFPDAFGTTNIAGSSVTFNPPIGTIAANSNPPTTLTINVTIPLPAGFDGPSEGEILIESAEGITKTVQVKIIRNHEPVANAGPDQTLYAGSNGTPLVTVSLDGSASTDPDADPLSYSWYENGNLLAETSKPQLTLGPGVHFIQLIVADRMLSSAPDTVRINVVEPVAAQLVITPWRIKPSSTATWVKAIMTLPAGIDPQTIDPLFRAEIYGPAGQHVRARYIIVSPQENNGQPVTITALFKTYEAIRVLPGEGMKEADIVCKLTSGQYINGTDWVLVYDSALGNFSLKPNILVRNAATETLTTYFAIPTTLNAADFDLSRSGNLYLPDGEQMVPAQVSIYPPIVPGEDPTRIKRRMLMATFSKQDMLQRLPQNGTFELYQECNLNDGTGLYALTKLRIVSE